MTKKTLFPDIPIIQNEHTEASEITHYGAGNYLVIIEGSTIEDYLEYLNRLENSGFLRYVDNGEGLGNTIYTSTMVKDRWVLTVTHIAKKNKTYISICYDLPLSEHLFYSDEYIQDNKGDACTKLHMLELWHFGNSFVLQLKNGHFIIVDGGWRLDLPYLLDYLEDMTTDGEKPVVEAWIFSHAHGDHCGVIGPFIDYPEWANRLFVEGIYFNEPNEKVLKMSMISLVMVSWIRNAARFLKTTKGDSPNVYRPQTGQRYYFNDITMDIVHAQEQLLLEEYSGDLNDSSTWVMFTIDGQKCLIGGDGDRGSKKVLMENYHQDYFDVDVFSLLHHGYNTQDNFTDFCKVKTLLITTRHQLPVRRANENQYLKEHVLEYFDWGDGTKILTFPYVTGSYETMPNIDWKYNQGQQRELQPNVFIYTDNSKKKEIRTLRLEDSSVLQKPKAYLQHQIGKRIPLQFTEDGMSIQLYIDDSMQEEIYHIYFDLKVGWIIKASDEKSLYKGIDFFLDTAAWSEKGFIPRENYTYE